MEVHGAKLFTVDELVKGMRATGADFAAGPCRISTAPMTEKCYLVMVAERLASATGLATATSHALTRFLEDGYLLDDIPLPDEDVSTPPCPN